MAMIKSKKYTGVYYNELENKDKVYYFNYKDKNDNNKLKWLKVGKESEGYTQDITKTLRDEQLSKMNHGEDITKVANKKKKELITLDTLANRYFEDRKSTNERKQKYTNHIKPLIGNKQIENITKVDIKKVVNSVLDLGRSNGTANSVLSLISTIINHNIKQHDLKIVNPCMGVSKLKDDNKRDRFLTTDEIKKLKDEVKENFFVNLFVEFALSTGGRLETILHIQKKDIDLINKTINLNNLKTKKRYMGFLQDDLIEILKEHLPSLNANDYVVTQKGLQEKKADHKQIHRRLKPILDRLFNQGLKDDDITNRAVIHTLRHTFASHLAINGTPIFTIQKLMNHSDIKQTLRYAKLAPDSGKNDVQGLYK
ncbi:tyrosine-type recombinase/integrase [Aliarcobacter butzleri]|uniref:tyrosine-type recombinase/integrase n=1 Tax=Aliarcobacter butzleri TaxID=28197 RepID=UPI003AF90D1F